MSATNYPFKNLVLKGGGIRGIAYLGALEVLYREGIVQNLEKVAGSSAGAITAMLVALGFDFDELKEISDSLAFKQIPGIPSFFTRGVEEENMDEATARGLGNWLSGIGTTISEVKFLFNRFGLHTSDYAYEWLGDQIAKTLGSPHATFKDLEEKIEQEKENGENGCKRLYITVTNISNLSAHICSFETTPDLPIADAVLTSMSIPIYFEAIQFVDDEYLQGYFGDGGVMNNYPINLFDKGIEPNWETLGLFLYGKVKAQSFPAKNTYFLKNFVGHTIAALLSAQDWAVARQGEDLARSIQIWDCAISATNFDVETGDDNYNLLVSEGRKGAEEYIKNYKEGNKEALSKCKFIPANAGMF